MKRYALLVPCYNAQNYIDSFLKNLSKLTITFDEVIFYDDASTDNTLQALESKGIRVIKGETNKGPGFARNRLAGAATSKYIHFHDIDDEFNPLFLQLVEDKLSQNQTDVILGYADWIDFDSRNTVIQWRYDEGELLKDPLSYFISNPLGIINTVYSRDIFLKVKGFNEHYTCWEDADLHVQLAAAGATFGVITQVLAYSLRHYNGISKNEARCWGCRLKFIESYLSNFQSATASLKNELKKVQNEFVRLGKYKQLGNVILLNKQHNLLMDNWKIVLIYKASKFLPSNFISLMLKLIR
jgi:glycosyltransferase involved in cell wall biosynthesis